MLEQFRKPSRVSLVALVLFLLVIGVIVVTIVPGSTGPLPEYRFISRGIQSRLKIAGCNSFRFAVTDEQSSNVLPNFRETITVSVSSSTIHPPFILKVYRATGRSFLFAPESVLVNSTLRRCVAVIARFVLDSSSASRRDVILNSTLVRPEPAFLEGMLSEPLRLPRANVYLSRSPLGKLYIDDIAGSLDSGSEDDRSSGNGIVKEKTPRMESQAVTGWRNLAARLHGKGRHLDWGTGSSSHFACGLYRHLHAIDSSPQWCKVVQSTIAESQSNCGQIQMHCINVGKTAAWGHPIPNVTQPGYFERYVHSIDTFQQPYFDSILVDGRFRTACAIKALTFLRADSFLMIHDFGGKRVLYNNVLKYYDVLAQYKTLIVLTPKQSISHFAPADYVQYQDSI